MNRSLLFASAVGIAVAAFSVLFWSNLDESKNEQQSSQLAIPMGIGTPDDPDARANWWKSTLADPATGEIPENMRQRELAFAETLPVNRERSKKNSGQYKHIGPFNVGGRTRAAAIDVSNEQVILAGGVSGGLWRSTDQGNSWELVSDPKDHQSVTALAQDTRAGKTDTWYMGGGEGTGNSANASFTANYLGNGMYKSIDGGLSWESLSATVSGTPQIADNWDVIWRIVTDPSNATDDILYVAASKTIFRSDDGGDSWTAVLSSTGTPGSVFSDVAITSSGVVYATFSRPGNSAGIWRSANGVDWINISPSVLNNSGTYRRIVPTVDPNDENTLYFIASTPNNGKVTQVFFGGTEGNSLYKYTYLNGDGSGAGGDWVDLSANIPDGLGDFGNFNAQGSYNLMIRVKPGDPNTIFIGGTNLYRSSDGFTTSNNTDWVGGYMPFTTLPFFELYPEHHPDLHDVFFLPSNPDVLFSASDGGIAVTQNSSAQPMVWASLNKGYITSQIYTVAIDHGTPGSNEITAGMQDNGTWWTNSDDPNFNWTMPSDGDGAHCAITDGGDIHYFSRQRGIMVKMELGTNGLPTAFSRFDPIGGAGYQFINPYILDPIDNNVMYLSAGNNIWRNDDLSSIPLDNSWDTVSTGWTTLTSPVPAGQAITALAASRQPAHRLYYGTSSKRIYRVDNANTGDPVHTEITNNIQSGGNTRCIAIDPNDADKVMVIYSNYNVYSIYYSEDGGSTWERVAGNLEAEQPPNAPPGLGIGDGPSVRWATIVPVADGTVYLVGTSVGLFATDQLDGEETHWIAQAPNSIGRSVVDVMDHRVSDNFVVLATHGNGIFTTNINSVNDIIPTDFPSSTEDLTDQETGINVYPNPASAQVNFEFELEQAAVAELTLFDASGRKASPKLRQTMQSGTNTFTLDVTQLPAGWYSYQLRAEKQSFSGRFIVK